MHFKKVLDPNDVLAAIRSDGTLKQFKKVVDPDYVLAAIRSDGNLKSVHPYIDRFDKRYQEKLGENTANESDITVGLNAAKQKTVAWLERIEGSELRKAKTLDAGLRAVAQVSHYYTKDKPEYAKNADPTRRPEGPPRATLILNIVSALQGHVICKGGRLLRQILATNRSVKIFTNGDTMSVSGFVHEAVRVRKELLAVLETVIVNQREWSMRRQNTAASLEPDDIVLMRDMERDYRDTKRWKEKTLDKKRVQRNPKSLRKPNTSSKNVRKSGKNDKTRAVQEANKARG